MAENYTLVNENGEVIADEVKIEPLSETEALAVGDMSTLDVEPDNGSKIPPILVKGLLVGAGYGVYKGAKAGIKWVKKKLAEKQSKEEDEISLTPEQLKVAAEAYQILHEKGLSDTAILYEAEESAKLYDSEEK